MRIIEKQTNKWDQFAQLIPLLKRTGRLQDAETIIGDMDERDCPGRRYCRALIDFSKLETEAAMNNLIISKRSKKWKNQSIKLIIQLCLGLDSDELNDDPEGLDCIYSTP